MRKYTSENHVIAAELFAMPNNAVAEWLKQNNESKYDHQLIEWVLYRRNDPLIDLALAKFGQYKLICQRLYHRGPLYRAALVQNPNIGPGTESGDMLTIDQAKFLAVNEPQTFYQLVKNPTCHTHFLQDVIDRENIPPDISEDNWRYYIHGILNNQQVHSRQSSELDFIDIDFHFAYLELIDTIWMLIDKVEPSRKWAVTLRHIDDIPNSSKVDYQAIYNRWDETDFDDFDKDVFIVPFLHNIRNRIKPQDCDIESSSLSSRTHYYSTMEVDDLAVLENYLSRDGIKFLEFFYTNPYYWQWNISGRQDLVDKVEQAWLATDTSFSESEMARVHYDTNRLRFEKAHPEWFDSEDESLVEFNTNEDKSLAESNTDRESNNPILGATDIDTNRLYAIERQGSIMVRLIIVLLMIVILHIAFQH